MEAIPESSLIEIHSGWTYGGGTWIQSHASFVISQNEGLIFDCRSKVSVSNGGVWGFFGGFEAEILFQVNESGDLLGLCRTESQTQIPLAFSGDLEEWHTYRIQAEATIVHFFVDGIPVGQIETHIPVDRQMQARLDRVSLGEDAILYVDCVSVY